MRTKCVFHIVHVVSVLLERLGFMYLEDARQINVTQTSRNVNIAKATSVLSICRSRLVQVINAVHFFLITKIFRICNCRLYREKNSWILVYSKLYPPDLLHQGWLSSKRERNHNRHTCLELYNFLTPQGLKCSHRNQNHHCFSIALTTSLIIYARPTIFFVYTTIFLYTFIFSLRCVRNN